MFDKVLVRCADEKSSCAPDVLRVTAREALPAAKAQPQMMELPEEQVGRRV